MKMKWNTSRRGCEKDQENKNGTIQLHGRLWRWHTNWCPGWKKHMRSLSENERKAIAEKYDMPKFK